MKKKIYTYFTGILFLLYGIISAQTFPNPTTLSTGQGAQGTLDPLWTVSPWYYSNPPNPMGLTYSAALINGNCAPGSWIDPTTLPAPVNNGNWITGADAPCSTDTSSGYRYFRLTLNLPADCNGNSVTTPGVYVLNLTGYVDNLITDVFVNGTSTGINGGGYSAGNQLNITLNGPWVAGVNYVDIQVFNGHEFPPSANPYGLLMVANTNKPSFYCSPYSAPNSCNTNSIRNTLIAAGNTELQGMDNTCSLYFINPQYMDGPSAQAYAQSFGANLISVQSAAENTALTTALSNQGYAGSVIWIGFIRSYPGGPFVWSDSSAISYTNWAPGEPNNSGGVESCTQIYVNGSWNDLNCTGYNSLSVIEINLCPVTTIRATQDTICSGQSTTLIASTLLGASPYMYTWTSVPAGFTSTSATITPSPTVTTVYNVTSVDRYGCTSNASYTVYVDSYTVTPSQTNLTCYGLNNGSASVSITGGLTAFTYLWSNGSTASSINGLTTGLYTVSINDKNNCASTKSFTITGPNASPLSITGPINPHCDTTKLDWVTWSSITATSGIGQVSSNLSISLTKPSGGLFTTPSLYASGNFPAQYNLPVNNTTLGNTQAGVFTFCFNKPVLDPQVAFSSVGQGGITVPIITSVPYTVIWPGINMSYPNNTTLIGTEGYSIIQFPGQHTCISFNYLTSENYCNLVFGIRDTNCQTTPICSGVATTFTASGAVTYTWSPATGLNTTNGSVVTANPSTYQTYTVIATDASGCVDTAITSVSVNPVPVPTITSFTNVSCFGANNGSIIAGVTQGTPPYHYLWTNGSTTTKDSLLAPGTYSMTVTDTNGCKGTISQLITQPPLLKDSISAFNNLSCFGIPNGSATVGVIGGTTPYSYSWNTTPAQLTATAGNLPIGSYTATVTDANLCSTTATVTLTQPPALTLTATTTDVTCKGLSTGSATATVSGGTGPTYTVGIINPPQGGITTGIQLLNGLAAGTYTIGAQDVNSCQTIFPITITEPPLLVASLLSSKNDSCFGTHNGNALANVVGGTAPYTYLWSNGNTTIEDTSLTQGVYTFTVTDFNNCTDTTVVTITQPPLLVASIVSSKNDSCFGTNNGNAVASAVGGTSPYLFSWNTTPAQANDTAAFLTAATYTATITDAQGCITTTTVAISQPPVLTLTASVTNVTCNGLSNGSATATATGGTSPYTYGWNFPPQQISTTGIASGFAAGTYTAGVQDVNGCLAAFPITVTEPAVLVASIASSKNDSCFGDSNGNAVVSTIGGTSPYTYLWNTIPPQLTQTASNLPAGTYTAIVTDAQACQDTAVVTITQPTVLTASITSSKNDSCFGNSNGNAVAGANGGTTPYAYSWNTTPVQTTSTASNLAAANYTATITDIKGCITTTTVTITQPVVLTVSGRDTMICISQTAILKANTAGGTMPYTYLWNATTGTQTNSVNPIITTTYTMQVNDIKGCSATNTVTVFVRDSLKFLAVSPGAEKCKGFTTNLNATGFGGDSTFTYTWISNTGSMSGQSVNVSPPVTTTYTLVLKDACNTPNIDTTVNVIIDPLPQISFGSDVQSGCYPLCVAFTNSTTISSTDTIKYNWNLGGSNSSYASTAINPTHCYKASGVYTVSLTATSGKGCISKSYISNMITAYPHPKAKFYSEPVEPNILSPLIQFTDASYAPGSGITSLFWQTFGDATDSTSTLPNPQHNYADTGTYCPTLIVTNTYGCKDTLTQCIYIEPYFTLYIPNAFSPNGDGYNDHFNVVGDYIFDFDMRIFDRWGNLVYHTTDVKTGWNGSMKGVSAKEDVYVYLIEATDFHNKSYSYKGTVTLIK